MLTAILAKLGLSPKTLPQANETLAEAKATLDSVAALFTAAGLNLEQMLAAGPDSLKAHIESLDNSEELATALQENERLNAKIAQDVGEIDSLNALVDAHEKLFSAVGFNDEQATPEAFKTAFAAHVSKEANLILARDGRAPVPNAPVVDDVTPKVTDEDKAARAALEEYEQLIAADNTARTKASGQAKTDFYAKHAQAISRGLQLRRRQ